MDADEQAAVDGAIGRMRPGSPTIRERAEQTRRLIAAEGRHGVAARLRSRAARWIDPPGGAALPLAPSDLAAGRGEPSPPIACDPSEPMQIAWVSVPQTGGAGGFTTVMRVVSALERAGHRCTLYLQDRHGWSMRRHQVNMRAWWPQLQAPVRDLADGIADSHAIFATSWETAYAVRASPAAGARLYLVQDHEPDFYPAGSLSLLAQATYRFGLHGLTAGPWLAQMLEREYGMRADHFELGCDLRCYAPDREAEREGVCMYVRPSTARRAVELGIAALDLFAQRHPEVEIHLYGERMRRVPFAARQHGVLPPRQLCELYNRCVAGLSLSATNVSLVPLEMLAAGCIPVVNDAEQNRMVLANPEVLYAQPTPFDLAEALGRLVLRPPAQRIAAAQTAAASVRERSWEDVGATVERVIRTAVLEAVAAREDLAMMG